MPNIITENGILIENIDEIVDNLTQGFKEIYGEDIVTESDSPDGQMINLFAQAKRDMLEYAVDVFNSFDPDIASGTTLDERVAYNGVVRKGGTYTVLPITIVASKTVTLTGLSDDETGASVFTVGDSSGNQFYLINTVTIAAGSTVLSFRARKMGAVNVAENTVTSLITPISGITSVTNASAENVIGVDQETDLDLRTRRAQAVGYSIVGSVEVLRASILDLENVAKIAVYENNTNTTDANGIPSHSIWVIVQGGNSQDIASTIFLRLNAGCGMKGSQTVFIETVYGNMQQINFDYAIDEPLYLRFNATNPMSGSINADAVKAALVEKFNLEIGQEITTTMIDAWLEEIEPNFTYYDIELDDESTFTGASTTYLNPTTKQHIFSLSADNITIGY